jgi:RNA polymerase sigma factor (sigma-70 family)
VREHSAAMLVLAANDGDQHAWTELVSRYGNMVWSIARAHRLDSSDAADVSQTVWLKLVENLDRLKEPDHVGGWLSTTTRHECLRVLRRSGRERPDPDLGLDQQPADDPSPEHVVIEDERRRRLWSALDRLSERCRVLLRALAHSPEASYADVAAALEMPVGSIGPTRLRCLERLRRVLAEDGSPA